MSIAKTLKKFTSYFLLLIGVFSSLVGVFNAEVYAVATEYEAHVAIFCDNVDLARQYIQLLHSYEYDGERKTLGAPGSGKSTEKTVITDGFGSRKYNVYFHIIDSNWALHSNRDLNNLIRCCTGAVILYDVTDPKLEPVLKSRTFYKEDIAPLLSIDTPLNNCIKYLQSFGRCGWWNALNFIMYNSEQFTPETHEEYRSQLNLYTLGIEEFYVDGDNKWCRNHPVWNSTGGINNVLCWISGQIYRSIFMERSLTGVSGLILKKKLDLSKFVSFPPLAERELEIEAMGETPEEPAKTEHGFGLNHCVVC
ncbi:MAG: hypothetical protein ACI4PR_02270 [Acutalibacteraceae bacterium]